MFKLLPHQEKVIDYARKHKYFICSVDAGGGKTSITLYIQNKLGCKTLVVLPSYLIPNWEKEIDKFFPGKKVLRIRSAKDVAKLNDNFEIVLASYGQADKLDPAFEWADLVAFDEGHYLKTMSAKRTATLHRLVYQNSIKRLLILTGTPITNRVREFYSLIAMCNYNPTIKDPEFLKKYPEDISFAEDFSFRRESRIQIYSAARGRMIEMPIVKYVGLKNVDKLKYWLKDIYIRIKDTEFMSVGVVSYKDFFFEGQDYPELLQDFNTFVESDSSISPKSKIKAALAKVPITVNYCKDLSEQVGKVVIYTDHKEPAIELAKQLGVKCITGDLSPDQRNDIAKEFKEGDTPYLVATIQSYSTGVDGLQSVCNHVVFNDPNWTPGNMKQAIKRLDRIGQKKPVVVHRILGTSQDEKIYSAIESKLEVIEKVTNL